MIEINKLKMLIDKNSKIWYHLPQYNKDDFGCAGCICLNAGKIIKWSDGIPRLEFYDNAHNFGGVMELSNLYENANEIFDDYVKKIQDHKISRLLIKPQFEKE